MSKKYFMKETGEELEFGDIIELNCSKELEDGRVTIEREIKFSEDTVDVLLDLDIIEVEDSLIDFSDNNEEEEEEFDCPYEELLGRILKNQEDLGKRVDQLEEKINSLAKKK